MRQLEAKGIGVLKLYEEERQIDFKVNGVKVTFFTSNLDILQKDS